ncbi:cation:proton antiporter [Leucobacter rhizosphaerae]|uniref:Cation:proton antiporter n=1 Tax=Leucobacter rhizosphaerae TaxID=2932245 RepID=A0ABY4FRV9_9MICO|nr:cation:proton antiporter [Leucobacter rhizosphaerae]UOQ59011.1 cation:proton antiporter [Leucobacter rhizosphaerae]
MVILLVCSMVSMLLWSLVSERLRRWHVSGPLAMVATGLVIGFILREDVAEHLNTDLAERTVEIILALLLFVDATEVRGGFLGGERKIVGRLLGIALPLSLLVTVAVGIPMLGVTSIGVVLAIACIVLPIDFAPAAEILRDPGIPRRLRHGLAVESGYNDGIFSPLFAFALLLLGLPGHTTSPLEALEDAVPAFGFAVLVGVGIGGLTGLLARAASRREWVTSHGLRIAMVLIPLVTYAAATAIGGNGFVAAFLAGIAYKMTRLGRAHSHDDVAHSELSLVDEIGQMSALVMWSMFGVVTALVFFTPFEWAWVVFALLALTVFRAIPVYAAFLGSGLSLREQTALGVLGPRGTSSVVFGLLAFNAMRDDDAYAAMYVMVMTVLGSVILYGVFGARAARRLVGPGARERGSGSM